MLGVPYAPVSIQKDVTTKRTIKNWVNESKYFHFYILKTVLNTEFQEIFFSNSFSLSYQFLSYLKAIFMTIPEKTLRSEQSSSIFKMFPIYHHPTSILQCWLNQLHLNPFLPPPASPTMFLFTFLNLNLKKLKHHLFR